jgi:energy-coupling factor transporter ATP-binding protein EcfA2
MAEYLLMFAKSLGVKMFSFASSLANGRLAKRHAAKRALRGDDLASEGSLESLVKAELRKLATSSALPEGLPNDAFRVWLLTEGCAERFVEVLISKAGGGAAHARHAEDALASQYELATGDTRKLATGPLNLVVSYVYGQLSSTEKARQALNNALALRNSAHTHALLHPEPSAFPTEVDLGRLWRMSADLLVAGKASWKMPAFIAPLTLEAYEGAGEKGGRPHPVTIGELVRTIEDGHSIVLFGDGGVGKTTLLLDLASLCTQDSSRRIPLYVDAAVWARAGVSIFDYVASTQSAQALGVTSGELAKLAAGGFLVLMVNGWNEIPANRKAYCREIFNLLITAAPALAIALASRTEHDATSLPSPRRIAVRGLTWQGQSSVIHSEMDEVAAHGLLEILAKDTRLRHAARSPLILRGLIAQVQAGAKATGNVYDLLRAAVMTFEANDQRSLALAEVPVLGMQHHYLEELACRLNARGSTNLSREDALVAIRAAADRMVKNCLLGTVPQPTSVLGVLASHHVLHDHEGLVRFAHQRFQEYFAATRLLRIESADDDLIVLLPTAVNEPAWTDSLELVAGKLKAPDGSAAARARLVRAAAQVDVAYACDLAGLCALEEADDAGLYSHLVSSVTEMSISPIRQVQELATACKIASRFPAFADDLWSLLDSDEQETRLNSHRLNGSSVSLRQLGSEAETRIKVWPSKRRSEFMYEIASNSDNYDFIVGTALGDLDLDVRAAAISALFWNFPASSVAIEAWLAAPLAVQTAHDLVDSIGYALEQASAGNPVREQLRKISASDIPDETRLRLAISFPDEVGPSATDVILARLGNLQRNEGPEPLIALARAYAPDRLRALALELVGGPRGTPEWVGEVLLDESAEVRHTAFEQAWGALQSGDGRRLSPESIGPLSNKNQTERSVAEWLRYCIDRRNTLPDTQRERGRQIGYLLIHAPGDDLLSIVMAHGVNAPYEQAVELADLLLTRISPHEERATRVGRWSMTSQQFDRLFKLLHNKREPAGNPQDRLFAVLSCIASHVAPGDYSSLLLEALRRQLDAWTAYRGLLVEWLKSPNTPRPSNPSLGNHVTSALVNWGMEALPGVTHLLSHQDGLELVPDVIARIASLPRASSNESMFGGVNADIEEGNRRRDAGRMLQQPTAINQAATDEAAKALGRILNGDVGRQLFDKEANRSWNAKQAEYRIGHLVRIIANLPSTEIVAPVTHALGSGLVRTYHFLDALRGLTRQGWIFSDANVVKQLEELFRHETSRDWIDESMMHALAQLSQLMFLVVPSTLLNHSLSHYLGQWQRFAQPAEVIRTLGGMKTEQAWSSLLAMGIESSAKGQPSEELVYALGASLTQRNFAEFACLVADGRLFSWCPNDWTVKRIAPTLVSAVEGAPESLSLLVDSCRMSDSPLAGLLLGEVLSKVDGTDERRSDIGLEALDAGRASNESMPAYRMLESVFSQEIPMGANQFETYPKACNPLRQHLYHRAKGEGCAAEAARRILASLECKRREAGRPPDEPRHPEPYDGLAWTDALWCNEGQIPPSEPTS